MTPAPRFALTLAMAGLLVGGCIANPTPHPGDDAFVPTMGTDTGYAGGADVNGGGGGGQPDGADGADPAERCRQRGGYYDDADGACRFMGADAGAMPDTFDPYADAVPAGMDGAGGDPGAPEDAGPADAEPSDDGVPDDAAAEDAQPVGDAAPDAAAAEDLPPEDAAPGDAEAGPDASPPDAS